MRWKEMVAQKYYWPGVYKDITAYICEIPMIHINMQTWECILLQNICICAASCTLNCTVMFVFTNRWRRATNASAIRNNPTKLPTPNSSAVQTLVPDGNGLIGPLPETPKGNKYINISNFTFDQAQMRQHLENVLSPFPCFSNLPRHSRRNRTDAKIKLCCRASVRAWCQTCTSPLPVVLGEECLDLQSPY